MSAYIDNTADFHQDGVILHEISCILFDHLGECVWSDVDAHKLASTPKQGLTDHLVCHRHRAIEEAEAELFARES